MLPTAATLPRPANTVGAEQIVRVAVCDDSPLIRSIVARSLESSPQISVVLRAGNGRELLDQLRATKVDVIVLDIEMPVMDGLTALPLILKAAPDVRVVMASTLTTRGADITMRALQLGAADYVPKPTSLAGVSGDDTFRRDLVAKVRALGARRGKVAVVAGQPGLPGAKKILTRAAPTLPPRVLAIGSSTGGPQALLSVIPALGRKFPLPILLTQHMPAAFTAMLAEHINRLGGPTCAEAVDGEVLRPGHVHLAPGGRHMVVSGSGASLTVRLNDDPPENFCRPAVDPLLRSLAVATGDRTLAVILTGMGTDGLRGGEKLIAASGGMIAQDEASSVVWGMPGAVTQAGLCFAVLPLKEIAGKILSIVGGRPLAGARA